MSDLETSAIDPSPAQAIRTPVLLRPEAALSEAQQREIARQDAKAFALDLDAGQRFSVAQIIGQNTLTYAAYGDEFIKSVSSELYAEVSSSALERNALRQVQNESERLQSMDRNTLLRDEASNLVDLHIESLSRIRNPEARYQATLAMGEIAQSQDSYSDELVRQSPPVAAEVQAAISENVRRVADKEDRKALDRAAMQPAQPENVSDIAPTTQSSPAAPGTPSLTPEAARAMVEGMDTNDRVLAAIDSEMQARRADATLPQAEQPTLTAPSGDAPQAAGTPQGTQQPQAQEQPQSIEGLESVPVKISDVDAALARLKLQYLLAGDKYYLRDDNKTLAFEDTGKRLVTAFDSAEIVRSMVDLSKAKGWSAIKATGSDTFRRKVWLEASLVGLTTQGYTPDAFDLDALQKRRSVQAADLSDAQVNAISQASAVAVDVPNPQSQSTQPVAGQGVQEVQGSANDLAKRYGSRLAKEVSQALADAGIAPGTREAIASLSYIAELAASPRSFVGKLLEHGPAPYEFKDGATASYFAKLQTQAGTKTVWGVDIPRALTESVGERVQVGDQVLLAFQGSKPVTVKDELTGEQISTHRNTWYTEKISELPSVAARSADKPSYSTIASAPSDSTSSAPTSRERVLMDVLQSKGAPDSAIAAVRAGLAAGVKPTLAPQLQPSIPVASASLPIRPTL
jgi:hypothetical protein